MSYLSLELQTSKTSMAVTISCGWLDLCLPRWGWCPSALPSRDWRTSASGCCERARRHLSLQTSCPPSSSDGALHDHSMVETPLLSVQFRHPREAFKGTEDNWYPTKTGFKLGIGHPTTCRLLEIVSPMRVWSIANWGWCSLIRLCSTLIPEHFNSVSLWFLLLPLQAHTEIHTKPPSYTVHKNISHVSQ